MQVQGHPGYSIVAVPFCTLMPSFQLMGFTHRQLAARLLLVSLSWGGAISHGPLDTNKMATQMTSPLWNTGHGYWALSC